jgi:hypothetical protein
MGRTRIIPRYKLMLKYNIIAETHDTYFQFITEEFVPGMQALGLYMFRVYHTAYGEYPIRQLDFLAEDLEMVRRALNSSAFKRLESRLRDYVMDYERKLVHFRDGFQF